MENHSCLFCKIIAKQIPCAVVKENDWVLVIRDISPKAPTHYLIMPKHHIESVAHLTDADSAYAVHILAMARDIAKEQSISSFNLIANNGAGAGQSVFHLHFHFLAGTNIYDQGLRL
jgi:histidine triad (HIT) family protein